MWFLLFVVHQITVPGTLPTTATGCGRIHPAPVCPIFYLQKPLGHSGDVEQLQSQCDLERKIRSESNSSFYIEAVRVSHCILKTTKMRAETFFCVNTFKMIVNASGKWWTVQTFCISLISKVRLNKNAQYQLLARFHKHAGAKMKRCMFEVKRANWSEFFNLHHFKIVFILCYF